MDQIKNLAPPSGLPPLRIHHLLTWMAVAALSFTLILSVSKRIGFQWTAQPIQTSLPLLLQTLAVTVLGFTITWYLQGYSLLEPGQGLLLLVGLQFIYEITSTLLVSFFPNLFSVTQGGPTEDFVLSIVNWGAVALVLVNVLIWAILYLRFIKVAGWRTYFLVMAVLQLAALVIPRLFRILRDVSPLLARTNAILSSVPSWILHFTAVAGLACLVIRDLRSSKRHHWSHWCGVVCGLLVGIRDLNMSIMQMMVQSGWMSNY